MRPFSLSHTNTEAAKGPVFFPKYPRQPPSPESRVSLSALRSLRSGQQFGQRFLELIKILREFVGAVTFDGLVAHGQLKLPLGAVAYVHLIVRCFPVPNMQLVDCSHERSPFFGIGFKLRRAFIKPGNFRLTGLDDDFPILHQFQGLAVAEPANLKLEMIWSVHGCSSITPECRITRAGKFKRGEPRRQAAAPGWSVKSGSARQLTQIKARHHKSYDNCTVQSRLPEGSQNG